MRRYFLRSFSWILPTVITATIAILAGGVNIKIDTTKQNVGDLLGKLKESRESYKTLKEDRKKLNDALYDSKKGK